MSGAESETVHVPARDDATGAADATALFRRVFDAEPAGVWSAPGRVNLIGEHVDYAGGICLPFALAQRTFAAVAPREDGMLRLVSDFGGADAEPVQIALSDVGPGSPEGWSGYAAGAIWAQQEAGDLPSDLGGFDIAITSDVPVGGGLSSSAALECSVALAARELASTEEVDEDARRRLVSACMRAENEVVGAATGGLDQRIALLGQPGYALAIDFGEDTDEQVACDLGAAGLELLVIDTRAAHSLADGQYASRRGVIDGVAAAAGANVLREVADPLQHAEKWAAESTPDGVDQATWADTVRRRVGHVLSENERTTAAIAQLRAGDFEAFGRSMCASHASLRDDYEVSCAELDLAVDTAMEHGAIGARMTGGGFGGSAIALVRSEDEAKVARAIADAFAKAGFTAPAFLAATPSAGARRVA
ncbi:galactokinase [Corynebacterium sp. TAE3-ERU12]|uniref:galactokinase n=1 Tax=Corynebacterium sp. TAE3-ERU12 TaxID=2849491 RepID=UPI001C44676B|nr:galactokinase [Corynebacterium sp. TAE3-ERU12]MBV7295260.1 galactokinase [Corynebacterium sp. TAE3-ERU12]